MSPEEKPAGQGKAGDQSPFSAVLLPLLTVIGTGIGAIGFVIFMGGFVVWARFDAIGLPGNEAVAQVPRSDLVATGASFLVPALLVALVAAAITVALWDFTIGSRRRVRESKAKADLMRADSKLTRLRSERERLAAKIALLEGRVRKNEEAVSNAAVDSEARTRARATQDSDDRELTAHIKRLTDLDEKEIPAAEDQQARLVEDGPTVSKSNKRERTLQYIVGGTSMLIAEVIVVSFGFSGLTSSYQAMVIGTMAATITVAIVVISMTDHFAWFTVCVFLGVGITVAVSTYARTQSHVKVSPVAFLNGSDPVAGYFVAETDDAVYLGVPGGPPKPNRSGGLQFENDAATLVRVPKASISGLTVGPIMDESDAYEQSLSLALALCRHAKLATVEDESTSTKSVKKAKDSPQAPKRCAPMRVRQLGRQLKAAT